MTTGNTTVTSSAPSWASGDPTTNINNAVASFVAGGTIRASHFNYIIDAINQMNGHTHTWTDYYQKATYGNNGDRANYSEDRGSNAPSVTVSINALSAGTVISASHHNAGISAVAALASHTHAENDRSSS